MKLYNYRTGELMHFGVPEMRWGRRRYQYEDGRYTPLGREHYGIGEARRNLRKTDKNEEQRKNSDKLFEQDLNSLRNDFHEMLHNTHSMSDMDIMLRENKMVNDEVKRITDKWRNTEKFDDKSFKEDARDATRRLIDAADPDGKHKYGQMNELIEGYIHSEARQKVANKIATSDDPFGTEHEHARALEEEKSIRQRKQREHYHDSWSNFEAKKKNWEERPEDKITEKHSSELRKRIESGDAAIKRDAALKSSERYDEVLNNYQTAMKRLNPIKTKKLREELQEAMKDARESNKNYQDAVMDVASEYINNNMPKAQRDAARAYVWVYLGNDW